MSHREEFVKALEDFGGSFCGPEYKARRATVLRLYDEAGRLSVSPPKFTQDTVDYLLYLAAPDTKMDAIDKASLRALADRISSMLSPAPPAEPPK